ncbi:MAG: type II toxin-antitoxin system VapC family toxin [Betaproteobacteria bacterium]
MILVVDASVALKWFLNVRDTESDTDRALSLLTGIADGSIQVVQPVHFIAEVTAVLAREKPNDGIDDLLDLMDIECRVVETPETYAAALTLAFRYQHHVFDTLYHAVALQTAGSTLVTADRRYFAKARREGQMMLLADWSPG